MMKFEKKDCTHLEQNREKHGSVEYKILKKLRKIQCGSRTQYMFRPG